jgi:hypothetical protein
MSRYPVSTTPIQVPLTDEALESAVQAERQVLSRSKAKAARAGAPASVLGVFDALDALYAKLETDLSS